MIRVQTYDSVPRRIQAGPIDPGAPRGAIQDVRGTAQDSLLADVLAAGKQLTGIGIQEYVKDETTRVSQSLLGMQQELNAERDRYMAENKGQDAIGAGQHFEQFAKKAAQKYLQEGKFSGRFAEMFMKQASGTALHFTEQGQAYGRQQKSAWEESVLQGDMEEFRKLVAQNYDNPELIEFSREALRQRIEGMRPGMDNRALFSRLDSQTAGSIIEGYLAHDDISGARGALDKYRDLLGGEVNRVEASIASHARTLESRRKTDISLTASGFGDQIAYGMDTGDFSAATATVTRLRALGAVREAEKFSASLQLYQAAQAALGGNAEGPLLEQEMRARDAMNALLTPDNAKNAIALRDNVEKTLRKRQTAFLNDPAGYVAMLPAMQQDGADPQQPASFADRSRRRLALQLELGQGLPYTPRILTDSEAQNARNEYDRQESPAAKAAYLGKLQAGTGDYFPQVLRELKMPPSVMAVAPVFSSLPQREAGLFLEASGLKPGDIPGGHDSDLRKEAEARVDASDIMQAVTGMAQDLPTSPQLRSLATHMRQAMVNADLLGLTPDTLDGMFTVIDDSGMRLVIPRSAQVDTDDLEDVLRSARKDVFRAYMQASTAAAGSYEDRLNAAKARALAENGIFISSGDGTGAVLVDPVSGAPVALPDGRLVRVPYAEVPARARKARDARMKQDLQEAVDTAMEGF